MLRKLLLSLLFITTVLNATTPTQENVTRLYIGYFDRAPDAEGLDYWVNNSELSLEEISASFFDQKETKDKYPEAYSNEDFIIEVYNNLFDRIPDSEGFDYWLKELNSGKISRALFILAIINGALGDDAKVLDNKTKVGLAFAKDGRDDIDEASAIMKGVTADPQTVPDTLCEFNLSGCPVSPKSNPSPLHSNPVSVPPKRFNEVPVADAGVNQRDVLIGDLVDLNGSASFDPDGNPLTYTWIMTTKPVGSEATLSNARSINPTFTGDKAGIYIIRLIVKNKRLYSMPSEVKICISPSVLIGDGLTSNSNTTRNVAVDDQGNIYVVYHSDTGIYTAKSTDHGQTFENPILLSNVNKEVEISTNGNQIFIAWVEGAQAMVSHSFDSGETYSIPVNAGAVSSSQVHMDTDDSNVYLISQNGHNFLYSNDNGLTFTQKNIAPDEAYSDVRVDPVSKDVFVQTDDPMIMYFESFDFGSTFSNAIFPSGSIYYSTVAISSGINGRYLLISGHDIDGNIGKAYRVDLDSQLSTELIFAENTSVFGRTLAADRLGNVVDGYQNGSATYFAVSQDLGNNFATAIKVSDDSEHLSIAIDDIGKRVVAIYTKNGQVYVNTYDCLLK